MLIVVEKKRRVERTVKLIRPSPSSEWPFMEAGGPSPLKVQISFDRDYKPGFLEAVKKRFVEIGGQLKT